MIRSILMVGARRLKLLLMLSVWMSGKAPETPPDGLVFVF